MDPGIIILLCLLLCFVVTGIAAGISFLKKMKPLTSGFAITVMLMLVVCIVLMHAVYKLFYSSLKDFNIVLYDVLLCFTFLIALRLSLFITKPRSSEEIFFRLPLAFYVLTIILSIFICLMFYFSVGFIESADLLGNYLIFF